MQSQGSQSWNPCMRALGRMLTTGWTTGIIHIWQIFTFIYIFLSKKWSQNPQLSLSICTLLFTLQKARLLHFKSVWTFVPSYHKWLEKSDLSVSASQSLLPRELWDSGKKAFHEHEVERRHLYSFAALAFLSGIFLLSVNIAPKDWPHLHYKYPSNGLE